MALTQVNSEGIKDGEVKNADMADDAVGVAELSATGTASNTTFLRGDNSWQTVSTTTEGEAVLSTTNSNEANTKFLRADGDGTCSWQTPPDTNTTYSVQDGQLSQNNFTDADHSKLDGIAAGATVGAALTGSTNNTITTVTGANAIQGEANLTYDGTDLTQKVSSSTAYSATATPQKGFQIQNLDDTTNSFSALRLTSGSSSPATAQISSVRTGSGQNDLTFQLETSNTAFEALRIDSSGKVGIGETSPGTLVHMKDADVSGASFNTDDKLTIENNGTTNINLVSGTTHSQFILFSDSGDRGQGYIKYNHAVDSIAIKAGGTESIEISATDLTVKDGNLVIGTAGHGIDFSAQTATSQSGSQTDYEVLDHYEEGTWTPVMQYYSSGSYTNVVFSDAPDQTTAVFTRIGNLVWFAWYSGYWTATAYNGTARITGLPFNATNNQNGYIACTFAHANCFTADVNSGFVHKNGNSIHPILEDSTSQATWENGNYLMVSGVYKVD